MSPTSPILRRPDTGCAITLSSGLIPSEIAHDNVRCKCIAVRSDEDIARLAASVRGALSEGILESEKPALAFAMLLLGGDIVYE